MIRFAENLNKMITAGLGGAMEAPRTEVAVGHCIRYLKSSGAVASFETNIAAPIRSLRVDMLPIQNLHGQVNPYPAGGGKNLLQVTATSQTINGVTFTVNADGTVTVNGTATVTTFFELIASNISFMESTILNGCPSGGGGNTYAIQLNATTPLEVGSGVTIAANTTITSVRIRVASGVNLNNVVFKPMIRLASVTDATFAPYSNICPISGRQSVTVTRSGVPGTVASVEVQLGQTVYGGTVDVVSGVLVVDKAFLTIDGTADWTRHASGKYYVSDITTGATQSTEYISNQYLFAGKGTSVSNEIDTDKRFYGQMRYRRIWVYDSQYTSLNDFKAALSTTPLQIVYPLAQPVTVQLSPQQITTLIGDNNVWSDAGDVSLEYPYYEETEGY